MEYYRQPKPKNRRRNRKKFNISWATGSTPAAATLPPNPQSARLTLTKSQKRNLLRKRARGVNDFVKRYYSQIDSNGANLATLYQEGSTLTFNGEKIHGSHAIVAKLMGIHFQHRIYTFNFQHSGPDGGILVLVSGNLAQAPVQPDALSDAYSTGKLSRIK